MFFFNPKNKKHGDREEFHHPSSSSCLVLLLCLSCVLRTIWEYFFWSRFRFSGGTDAGATVPAALSRGQALLCILRTLGAGCGLSKA